MTKLPVICLMGPTAIGKTDLAIELHEKLSNQLPIELISVDSAMIYKGLNIGTGKPEQKILDAIPHRLVDIREPSDVYSVADFCRDVKDSIATAYQNNKCPLLVGGTMMYFNALQYGLAKLPESNKEIRDNLQQQMQTRGLAALYQDLQQCDEVTAKRVDPNDTQRILRALEVFLVSGRPMSELIAKQNQSPQQSDALQYEYINLALILEDRTLLHKRIETRFHNMLKQGFLSEVEILFKNAKLNIDLPAIRSCGYRQAWKYFFGEYTKEEMIDRAIISTRQLAKRQCTWLRSWENLNLFDTQDDKFKENIIKNLLAFDLFKRII